MRFGRIFAALLCGVLLTVPLTACKDDSSSAGENVISEASLNSKVMAANLSAQSVYTAVNSALTDLSLSDADMTAFNQTFFYTQAELSQCDTTTPKGQLCKRIFTFCGEISDLKELAVTVEQSTCKCVALKLGEVNLMDGSPKAALYGSYPNQVKPAQISENLSLQSILNAAS